jgi:signal transduction histidine kinase
MRWLVRFPRAAIGIVGIVLILAGGTAVGILNLRNLQRIDVIHSRVADLERLRELRQRLEISLLDDIRGDVPTWSFLAEDVRLQVESVLALQPELSPEAAAGLEQIRTLLSRPGIVNRETLISALELAGSVAELEARSHSTLLREVQNDSRRELYVGLTGLLALTLLVAVAAWLLPKRLLNPLAHLGTQFSDVGAGRYEPIPLEGVDPALLPLFENYNGMVDRLAQLEAERTARAETLEAEVRAGARALLEQHRVLADAERLAAVGETAAGLAHELRNPLAGIMAALANLGQEVEDEGIEKRVGLLRKETERIVRLLNEYLEASRHAPEPLVMTSMEKLVEDLLSLLRYQASGNIRLEDDVGQDIECLLPPGRIRQALMNLVGNAIESLGDGPGTITVLGRRVGTEIHLEVRDDGPGFPEDILRSAGQPFRTGRDTGTGLGLATVHRTAVDLGGSMTIRNLQPRGASVTLSLPCRGTDPDTGEGTDDPGSTPLTEKDR